MVIREEIELDASAIVSLTRTAFNRDYEVELIRKLWLAGLVIVSLAAVEGDSVVGHILFSQLGLEVDRRKVRAAALAPMAVTPNRQRRGIGTRLVGAGLEIFCDRGYEAVIVLGHPSFYERFGFSAALTQILEAAFRGNAFMGLELVPGSMSGTKGLVIYPEAFGVGSHSRGVCADRASR